jgi:hypothetical protein
LHQGRDAALAPARIASQADLVRLTAGTEIVVLIFTCSPPPLLRIDFLR